MLEYLHLKNVGPASEMEVELAPRLNLITGDNGLGKSFSWTWHGGRSRAPGRDIWLCQRLHLVTTNLYSSQAEATDAA